MSDELDRAVAVEVMNYKPLPNGNWLTSGSTGMFAAMSSGDPFCPSEAMNHAMMVVEKMREKGWKCKMDGYAQNEYAWIFYKEEPIKCLPYGYTEKYFEAIGSLPTAISEAALAAVRKGEEK